MLWADEAGYSRRPIVAIEDHLYHTADLLQAVATVAPDALSQFTICALDRSGPDTDAALSQWATRFPAVRVVTPRSLQTDTLGGFARDVARLLRPGGIVLQDIQLTTLPFIPADRWWESIYLGATIRGLFAERQPVVRFCSNKRGYDATFGKDLLDAGFDPRDVMDKGAMATSVVPALLRMLRARFPLTLETAAGRLPASEQDRADVESECDIVLWRSPSSTTLGGRNVEGRTTLKAGAPEIETWRDLIEHRLQGGDGIAVLDVGARLSEPNAERAEQTNLAARHIHSLRARLRNGDAIQTANHRYKLADSIVVALV